MPIIHSKSKKAFVKNLKEEMKAGKPKDQSLAIAYSIQRKNKKKMSDGGQVSASDEKRPMPDSEYSDSKSISRNSSKKSLEGDSWTDDPMARDAQKPSPHKMSEPMDHDDDLKKQERDLMDSSSPESYDEQPPKKYDEMDPKRQGPKPPMPFAKGGMIRDMYDVPVEEAEEEHHASVAAAIMAKMKKMYEGGQVEGSDESEADLDLNSMEQPNEYYERNEDAALKENYDSDFEDLSQPEDSNMHGESMDDDRDLSLVEKIRKSMKSKRGM